MAIRKDEAQLIITIDSKESLAYQESLTRTKSLVAELRKLKPGTDEYNKALQESLDLSRKLSSADFSKLSVSQLGQRKKALEDLRKLIPQVTFTENGFEKELQKVNQALSENASRTKAVNKILNENESFLGRVKTGILSVAGGYALWEGAKSIVSGLLKSTIGLASNFETTAQSFKVLVGDADKAKDLIDELNEFSVATPFEPDEIQQSAKTLLGFGRDVSVVKSDIEILGNASAATGADLKGLSTVFGQVAGAGRLMGQDALQFISQGVPVYQLLSEYLGKSTAEVKKLQEQGKITFDDLRNSFVKASEDGGKFSGALEAQSQTFSGLISTLKGNADEFLKNIGEKILPVLKPLVEIGGKFLQGLITNLFEGKKATGEFSGAINITAGVIRIVVGLISGLVQGVIKAGENIYYMINAARDLPIIGSLINVVINSFSALGKAISNSTAVFSGTKAAIKAIFDNVKNYITSTILTLKIFAKEAELFLTIDKSAKEKLRKELKSLEALKKEAKESGKSVGQAYTDGYNEELYRQLNKELDQERNKNVKKVFSGETSTTTTNTDTNSTGSKEQDKKFKEEFDLLKDSIDAKQQLNEISFKKNEISEQEFHQNKLTIQKEGYEKELKFLEKNGKQNTEDYRKIQIKLLDVQSEYQEQRIKSIEEYAQNMLAEEEKRYLQGKISEEQYELVKLNIKRGSILAQLAELKRQGKAETDLYKEKETELLKTQKDIFDKIVLNAKDMTEKQKKELEKRLQDITNNANQEIIEIDRQEINKLITVKEANQARRNIQIEAFKLQLDILKAAGLELTEEYIKIEKAMTEAQRKGGEERREGWKEILKNALPVAQVIADGVFDIEKQKAEQSKNEKIKNLEQEYEKKFELAKGNAQQEELLKKQFESKKRAIELDAFEKNKKLQIAQTLINSALAATAIFAVPDFTFGIATAAKLAALAITTATSIATIKAQKFDKGGRILPRIFGSQRISTNPNIPTQSGGDNVLAMVKPGEVVLNEEHQARAGGPAFFRALGVPGFNTGGLISPRPITLPNTSPAAFAGTIAPSSNVVQTDPAVMELANSVRALAEMMPEALSNIQANVNYFDVAEKASDLATIQRLASY